MTFNGEGTESGCFLYPLSSAFTQQFRKNKKIAKEVMDRDKIFGIFSF